MEQQIPAGAIKKLFSALTFLLTITGLIISAYLYYQHYLIINEANGSADICYAVFGRGCSSALSSPVGVQLGLPLAGWGIIYYTLVLLLLPAFLENKSSVTIMAVPAITFAACVVSVCLLVMIYFDHALFCPFCVMLHGINFFLLFCVIKIVMQSSPGFIARFPQQVKSAFKRRAENKNIVAPIKRGAAFPLLLVIIFLYTLLSILLVPRKIIFDEKKFTDQFDTAQQQKIMVDDEDPVYGPVNAPVQLVVFSDFECAACRNFSNTISRLDKMYHGKFNVVFKNFPLGRECNPIFGDYDLHPKACGAARAAEAARLQQKFWPYHDQLFSVNLEKTKETFLSLAVKTGLDVAQFNKDSGGEMVNKRLAASIEQGKQLGIKGTPAVFINGRKAGDHRLLHMKVLLDHLLDKQ